MRCAVCLSYCFLMQAFASLNISPSWDYCGTVPALNERVHIGGTVRHITVIHVSVLCRTSEIISQFLNRGAWSLEFSSLKCKTRTMETWISSAIDQILYIVYCILHTLYCILYIAYCILHTVYCIVHTVYCILHTVYCVLYIAYCILYIAYSILYSV